MSPNSVQMKIGTIIILAIGTLSLILLFKGVFLWAGVVFILMGIVSLFMKRQGAELNILIGFFPILLHYQQMKFLILLSVILMFIALYDMFILMHISSTIKSTEKREKQKEIMTRFREEELVHQVVLKLEKLLGLKNKTL